SDADTFDADAYTLAATREIADAITDPDAGRGWALRASGAVPLDQQSAWVGAVPSLHDEVADLCEGARVRIGGFLFQRTYSNVAAARGGDPCVPAMPDAYFSTTPAVPPGETVDGWTDVAIDGAASCAGGETTVSIPIYGWSGDDGAGGCASDGW